MLTEKGKKNNLVLIPLIIILNSILIFNEAWKNWLLAVVGVLILATIYFIKINTWDNLVEIIFILTTSFLPMVVIERYKDSFYYGKSQYLIYFSVVLFIAWWFKIVKKGGKLEYTIVDKLLGIYALLIILSTIFSVSIIQSLQGASGRRESTLALLSYIFLMFIFSKYYKFKKVHLEIFLVAVCLIVIYGFIQFYMGYDYILGIKLQPYTNAVGTLGHRNFMGSFITLCLPISICTFLYNGKTRYYIYAMTIFGGLLCCLTRSAWVTFPIYFTIILFYFVRRKNYTRKIVILIAGFTLVFITINVTTNNSSIEGRATSFKNDVQNNKVESYGSNRVFIWLRTPKLILDRPFLGSGVDTFDIVFREDYEEKIREAYGGDIIVDKAHNEVLQIAVTTGVPAAILYMAIVLLVIYIGYKETADIKAFSLISTVAAYFIQSMFNISNVGIASIYWIAMGLIMNFSVNNSSNNYLELVESKES